jgi:O-antigen ligase
VLRSVEAGRVRFGSLMMVASAGLGVLVAVLPSFTLQVAVVLGAAAATLTVAISRAGRALNPALVIVAWLYLIGPIGLLLHLVGVSLSPVALLVVAPVPFALATLLLRAGVRRRLTLMAPLVLLLAFAALSLTWSPNPAYGAEKLNIWALTCLLPAAFVLILADDATRVSWKLIAVAAFVSAVGLVLFGVASETYPGRPTLFDENPIWAARAAFVGALVVLFGPLPRIAKLSMPPVMIVAGLLTQSLGPFLGLALGGWAGAFEWLRTSDRTDGRVALGWLVFASGTVMALTAALIAPYIPELATLINLVTNDRNVTSRAGFLNVAVTDFLSAPVAGIGFGGFAASGLHLYPHNIVAEIAAELGSFGLLALTCWLGLALRGAAGSPILVALVVGTGTFSLFSGSVAGNGEFWMFSALAVAMIPLRRSADDRPPEPGDG